VGEFSHKFSIAPSGQTTDQIKKSWGGGAKMVQTCFITMPIVVGILGHMPAVDKKSVIFCLFVMMKFVIMETLWSNVIFKTVIVSLYRGRFVVVHLYSTISVAPKIFPLGQIYTKNCHFSRFWYKFTPNGQIYTKNYKFWWIWCL